MSAQIGPYVPLLIVAMVTWKVANSPSSSSSSASATSTSTYPYRTSSSSSSSRSKNSYMNAWGSSISERASARSMASSSSSSFYSQGRRLTSTADVRHSRTGSSPRSLAGGMNGHVRRGPQSMSPGAGGMRTGGGGGGGRITGGASYGARGPGEGGRR